MASRARAKGASGDADNAGGIATSSGSGPSGVSAESWGAQPSLCRGGMSSLPGAQPSALSNGASGVALVNAVGTASLSGLAAGFSMSMDSNVSSGGVSKLLDAGRDGKNESPEIVSRHTISSSSGRLGTSFWSVAEGHAASFWRTLKNLDLDMYVSRLVATEKALIVSSHALSRTKSPCTRSWYKRSSDPELVGGSRVAGLAASEWLGRAFHSVVVGFATSQCLGGAFHARGRAASGDSRVAGLAALDGSGLAPAGCFRRPGAFLGKWGYQVISRGIGNPASMYCICRSLHSVPGGALHGKI